MPPVGNDCVLNMVCQVASIWMAIEMRRAFWIFSCGSNGTKMCPCGFSFMMLWTTESCKWPRKSCSTSISPGGDKILYDRILLRVYNQTLPTGHGYHFDALVPVAQECETPCRTSGASSASASCMPLVERTEKEGSDRRPTPAASHAKQKGKVGKSTAETPMSGRGHLHGHNCNKPLCGRAQELLQTFFWSRGASITISSSDAADVVALWGDREGLGAVQ